LRDLSNAAFIADTQISQSDWRFKDHGKYSTIDPFYEKRPVGEAQPVNFARCQYTIDTSLAFPHSQTIRRKI